MYPFRSISRRRGISMMAIAAMALVACEGPFCHDTGQDGGAEYKTAEEARGATPTASATVPATATASVTATATAPASTTATATATSTATPVASATTPAPSPTATSTASTPRPQTVRLRADFGVDHPPFARNYGVGGNSVGLACVSGIPAGGIIIIRIGGATGAPPSITGTDATGGGLVLPFPIEQYGAMDGAITSLRVNGQPADFTADPFSYTVGEAERICAPPR